jgi:hypothetical protein
MSLHPKRLLEVSNGFDGFVEPRSRWGELSSAVYCALALYGVIRLTLDLIGWLARGAPH